MVSRVPNDRFRFFSHLYTDQRVLTKKITANEFPNSYDPLLVKKEPEDS